MKVLLCLLAVIAGALGRASVSLSAPSGRVVGGRDALRGQFPFQVSIQFCLQSSRCQHTCGGVIATLNSVLSAAHCVTNAPTLGAYRVLAGVLNLNDDNPERQFVSVSHVLVHPDYQGGVNPHDIAIFKLLNSLYYSDYVIPARFPQADFHESGNAVVIGWGSIAPTETPTMPTTLQSASTTILNITLCKTALDTVLGGAPHPLDLEDNICTGPLTGGVSICTGDSGGPLIYTRFDNVSEVIGITSWGVTPCGTVGAPSVYVKINHYLPWIYSHIYG